MNIYEKNSDSISFFYFYSIFVLILSEKLLDEHALKLADLHKNLAQKEGVISMLSKEVTQLRKDLAFCKKQVNRRSSGELTKESPGEFTTHGEALMTTDFNREPQQKSPKKPVHMQQEFHPHPWIQETPPKEVCCN